VTKEARVPTFRQVTALQQQITPGKIPRCLLVLQSSKEERKRTLERLGKHIEALVRGQLTYKEGGNWSSVASTLLSPSLFGEEEIVLWDVGGGPQKEDQAMILSYMQRPSPCAYLILGGESLKTFSFLDKELLTLDLTEEKPWEKEKRLKHEAIAACRNLGKSLSPGALEKLFSSVEGEESLLSSEIQKLVLYVGERKEIGEQDVTTIGAKPLHQAGWHQAESLIWGGIFSHAEVDLSFLLGLLGQMRFILQQARQASCLLEEQRSEEEMSKLLRLKPFACQKLLERLRPYESSYFALGLDILYDVEFQVKNSVLAPKFLLDLLRLRFAKARKTHAR